MKLIALGANLPSVAYGPPIETLRGALALLAADGMPCTARSRWYATSPVPASDQPDFVNSVAAIETDRTPAELLGALLALETRLGRVRGAPNAARVLDLDLLDYDGLVQDGPPILPHPRLAERAFVLFPLRDVARAGATPESGLTVDRLIAAAGRGGVRVLDD